MLSVSVLIPTVGRDQELIQTLESLEAQSRRPDEIIVIDQNDLSKLDLRSKLSKFKNLKHITNIPTGVVPNYNRALREAKTDIVIFVDDDVMASKNLILAHVDAYKDDSVGCVAGRIFDRVKQTDVAYHSEIARFDSLTSQVTAHFNQNRDEEVDFPQGCNMSFRRKLLLDIGGFDERFLGNGYFFEVDVGLRVKQAGMKVVFEPRAELIHFMAERGGARVSDKSKHTYYFVKNGKYLMTKHSKPVSKIIFPSRMLAYGFLKALYNLDISIFKSTLKGLYE